MVMIKVVCLCLHPPGGTPEGRLLDSRWSVEYGLARLANWWQG